MEEKLNLLRGSFAAALKYCPRYADKYPDAYKSVLKAELLPKEINLLTLAGDYFAFWYLELKLPSEKYEETAKSFFIVLYP